MGVYIIQHKIHTLLHNNAIIYIDNVKNYHYFTSDNIIFKSWSKDIRYVHKDREWIAECKIEAESGAEALNLYSEKIARIIPRISLIGQAYIDDKIGSILITKESSNIAWFRCVTKEEPLHLNFRDDERLILDDLIKSDSIPDIFYLYWNEAVNNPSYSGKLLLMFGAIDSLAKNGDRKQARIDVLGEDLSNEIYKSGTGLRHIITHGDSLTNNNGKNYVEIIHKKILSYFNETIISDSSPKINLDIVEPQRQPFANYRVSRFFIEQKIDRNIDIYTMIEDLATNFESNDYKILYEEGIADSF